MAAALSLVGCSDNGPLFEVDSIRFLDGPTVTLEVGQSLELGVECLDQLGRVIKGHRVTWAVPYRYASSPPVPAHGRVVLDRRSNRARVRAIGAGTLELAAACLSQREFDSIWWGSSTPGSGIHYPGLWGIYRVTVTDEADPGWALDAPTDTLRLRAPTVEDSTSGVTALLTVRDNGPLLLARDPVDFAWSIDDNSVATVTSDGLVRAVGAGDALLRVQSGSQQVELPIRVAAELGAGWDIGIVDAHWTQGAQDAQQRVPMVSNGRAAAVNVLAFATPGAAPSDVVLEVWDAQSNRIWTDRVALNPDTAAAPTFATPSAQFLVPRTVLRSATRWRVVRDSSGGPDALAANDAWPRSGSRALSSFTAPPLDLRLVPLRLAGNDNAITPLTDADRVWYDSIARIRLPLGEVNVRIEAPLTVQRAMSTRDQRSASPGIDAGLFEEYLDAVDARRLASGSSGREAYWLGVIPRFSPDAGTPWGGMAYIPSSASETGPMARSMVALSHEWYTSPVSAGGTVSHELGHAMGLRHAPCGSAAWPDPAYPVPDGAVGNWVHWVSAWEHGTQTSAPTIAPTTGDFMGYCGSGFVGPYHMRALIEWRAMSGAALQLPSMPQRVAVVRGMQHGDRIEIYPITSRDADPAEGSGAGPLVELLAPDGRVLRRVRARSGQLSDGSGVPFVAYLPIDLDAAEPGLRIRVSDGALSAESPLPTGR